MANFQDPPTYAEVVLVDEKTGHPAFNPIWLEWFIAIAQFINSSCGGGGTVQHNSTGGLQGGTANQFYHLTATEYNSGNFQISSLKVTAGRLMARQGAAVTAANNLTLGTDGNYFQVAGATQINLLDSTSWQGGAEATLKFNSNPVVKHNQAASGNFFPIMLAGGVDFSTSANATLTVVFDATDSKWYEKARKT